MEENGLEHYKKKNAPDKTEFIYNEKMEKKFGDAINLKSENNS